MTKGVKLDVPVRVFKLDNGLRIFHLPMRGCPVSYVRLGTRMGMNAEDKKVLWESAHAIEHMLAGMTSKKNPSAKDMTREMNQRGISSNAYTTRTSVYYYMSGLAAQTKWMLDAVVATYLEPHFDQRVFKQEMNAVTQELNSDIADTWYHLDMKTTQELFPGLPISVTTKDKLSNVKNLTPTKLFKLAKLWYEPQLVDLYLAGAVSCSQVEKVCRSLARKVPGETSPPLFPPVERSWGSVFRAKAMSKNNLGVKLIFPLELSRYQYRKERVVQCLSNILTDGLSSRLYVKLRADAGLVYTISSDVHVDLTPENSYFMLATEASPKNITRVVETILATLGDLIENGVTSCEMRKWVQTVKTDDAGDSMSREPVDFVSAYSPYLSWGHEYPTRKELSALSLRLKKNEIDQLARDVLGGQCMLIHTGDKKTSVQLEKLMAH